MRIALADFCKMDFHAQSVDTLPLGGAHSAACYLARALAKLGHEVFLIGNMSRPGLYDGVTCLSWAKTSSDYLVSMKLDAFICILGVGMGIQLRDKLGSHTRLILWNQHAPDQPDVKGLSDPVERNAYDGMAMVSEWEREEYLRVFGIDRARTAVLRNAIAPAFCNLFADRRPVLPRKTWPPLLAYTSTPFRGLDLLLEAFPRIRRHIPGARLQVFSSMKVYQTAPAEEEAQFGRLYRRCRETEGVEYVGSIPQRELARALRSVTLLAYPNTFPETSCIAVMEAMASGCRIVTSALGALPETTGGFATLIPFAQSREAYLSQFVDESVKILIECRRLAAECENLLQRQLAYINSNATWEIRAGQWVQWLQSLPTERPCVGASMTGARNPSLKTHNA